MLWDNAFASGSGEIMRLALDNLDPDLVEGLESLDSVFSLRNADVFFRFRGDDGVMVVF